MCPLRLILIFLSATLAGFFVLRNLKSHEPLQEEVAGAEDHVVKNPNLESSKVRSAFWTCVDMASGRYLWRHLVSASSKNSD
ncbi:uncharacterized protein LOC121239000 [Juglans microcarpa x Juglans regia]|uniref:uncharacterized protein LOC121239000 n=1 Tax=Juglans microcarpa x Juglans regia TaxID=2249226 RepID=UPI001B7EDDD2|nr:uncharacterized protein LOC121239000 [Juglans microcarpa x Juglans regia]